jgi:hypothetical protein
MTPGDPKVAICLLCQFNTVGISGPVIAVRPILGSVRTVAVDECALSLRGIRGDEECDGKKVSHLALNCRSGISGADDLGAGGRGWVGLG